MLCIPVVSRVRKVVFKHLWIRLKDVANLDVLMGVRDRFVELSRTENLLPWIF